MFKLNNKWTVSLIYLYIVIFYFQNISMKVNQKKKFFLLLFKFNLYNLFIYLFVIFAILLFYINII